MARAVALLALALALVATGCVAPPSDPAPADAPLPDPRALPFPDPMGHDHDHADVSLHANAYQMTLLDHHPLAGTSTRPSGAHALDLKAGWLFAAVYGGEADAEGGVFVFDASEPAAPKPVGRFQFPGPLGGDRSMEATDDADFVVLGSEVVDCAGHLNPFAPGLYLVDVRDKANPRIVHHVPDQGVHSVTIHRIDGVDYVFALMTGDNILRINRDGPTPTLERIGSVPIGHDSVAMDDPLLGVPLLYVANGGGDFVIYDVSDPARPEQVAEWAIPDREEGKYYVHTGAVQIIDGRRIAVVSSEDWLDYPSALWVLDATDFGLVETLSNWSAPGDHAADGLRYSMHNPRFHGSTLLVTYYHGGVWALDLSTAEKRAAPQVVGQYMPSEPGGAPGKPRTSVVADNLCGAFNLGDAPLTFDVESGDGVVYVADLPTGLYTLRPEW